MSRRMVKKQIVFLFESGLGKDEMMKNRRPEEFSDERCTAVKFVFSLFSRRIEAEYDHDDNIMKMELKILIYLRRRDVGTNEEEKNYIRGPVDDTLIGELSPHIRE